LGQPKEKPVFIGRGLVAILGVAICSLTIPAAFADVPTSQPVSPTTRPVDRSTPRAGLMAYFQATYRKDYRGAAALCYAKDKEEQELALALSTYGLSEQVLREIAQLTLGNRAMEQLIAPPITEEELDKGSVEMIDSDTAKVYSEAKMDWPMVRVNGQWCLAVGMCAQEEHMSPGQMTYGMIQMGKRNETVMRNLVAGKRADVEKIKQYLSDGRAIDWK
jgi:hypothetical protein